MAKASYDLTDNLGNAEFGLTPDQASAVSSGCAARALGTLTPDQKASLKEAIVTVRADVVSAADIIQAQKNRNRDQMTLLKNQINSLTVGTSGISNFRRGLDPAIASCSDVANLFEGVKSLSDQVYSSRIELNYRLSIKQLLDTALAAEVSSSQSTLESLDNLSASIT